MDGPRFHAVGPKRFSKRLSKHKHLTEGETISSINLGSASREMQLAPNTSSKFLDWDIFEQSTKPPFWRVTHRKSSSNLQQAIQFRKETKEVCSDDEYNGDLDFLEDVDSETQNLKTGNKDNGAWRRTSGDVPYCLVFYGLRGEAELIRLLFIMSGEPYDERQILEEDEKAQVLESTPYNALPVLAKGGEVWGNTEAIVRTLARKFHMMGQTNHEHLVVEAMFERMCQLKRNHSQVVQTLHIEVKNKEKMEWMYHQLRYVILPPALAEWEKLVLCSKGPFIVASGMSLADVAIMDFLDQCSLKIHLDDVLGDFDALTDLIMLVKRHQRIANYLDDRGNLEWSL